MSAFQHVDPASGANALVLAAKAAATTDEDMLVYLAALFESWDAQNSNAPKLPTCRNKHALAFSIDGDERFEEGFYCDICEICSEEAAYKELHAGSNERWFCDLCNYDACITCHPKPTYTPNVYTCPRGRRLARARAGAGAADGTCTLCSKAADPTATSYGCTECKPEPCSTWVCGGCRATKEPDRAALHAILAHAEPGAGANACSLLVSRGFEDSLRFVLSHPVSRHTAHSRAEWGGCSRTAQLLFCSPRSPAHPPKHNTHIRLRTAAATPATPTTMDLAGPESCGCTKTLRDRAVQAIPSAFITEAFGAASQGVGAGGPMAALVATFAEAKRRDEQERA